MLKFLSAILFAFVVLFSFTACNHFTYRPHSNFENTLERPSAIIPDRIIDFRIKQGGWPISKVDFMYKDAKYYEALNNFPYQTTSFKIKDSNNMVFYFSDNIKDIIKAQKTKKQDLNSFKGSIKFWKEADKFFWKINMK